MRTRYGASHQCPKCERQAKYYRVKSRRCYECEHCGYQVYPTARTPFENTRTSLKDWFFVMFLFCASRNGVAAKEVQRQIGVTYKTAWRMCRLIRLYMGFVDGDAPLGGPDGEVIEIDETFIGGKDSTPAGGPRGKGEVDPKNIGKKDGWGNLPPKERQEVLQQIGRELPAHFRETIEEYFKRLAQDGVK